MPLRATTHHRFSLSPLFLSSPLSRLCVAIAGPPWTVVGLHFLTGEGGRSHRLCFLLLGYQGTERGGGSRA
ncbi:hypothetical protein Hanom_Chr12g01139811 [Helianthus anomalus]